MTKIKLLFLILIYFITNAINAVDFDFLVPNCMNDAYWDEASSSIDTAEEKLDIAVDDCTTGLDAELASCNSLDEFPPAAVACDAAAIAGCGVSIGIFGESVGVGIDDTAKIIGNCISLIPIAAYAVSMTESGNADEAIPCMLDIFGAATDVIPELKDLDIDKVISEFKTFNGDVTKSIQDVIGVFTSTVNDINKGLDKVIKATSFFPPLSEVLKLVKKSLDIVFDFVPTMEQVAEMAPLLIMANTCNNYSSGLGGIGCLAIIQDSCSKYFKGKKGSVPPQTSSNSNQARNAINNASSIINKITNETQKQANKESQEKKKASSLEAKYKKCKKLQSLIQSIPAKDRNQIPEADIEYFDNNCKSILKSQ